MPREAEQRDFLQMLVDQYSGKALIEIGQVDDSDLDRRNPAGLTVWVWLYLGLPRRENGVLAYQQAFSGTATYDPDVHGRLDWSEAHQWVLTTALEAACPGASAMMGARAAELGYGDAVEIRIRLRLPALGMECLGPVDKRDVRKALAEPGLDAEDRI